MKFFLRYIVAFLFLVVISILCLFIRFMGKDKRRVVLGSTPLINYSLWSKAISSSYESKTFVNSVYGINSREDWDLVLNESFTWLPNLLKPYLAFLYSIYKFDIFVISYDGYFLGNTPLNFFQAGFLMLAKKKIIVLPYGSDSYVYRNVRSVTTSHGLQLSYPNAARNQKQILKRVDYWNKNADAVVPAFMGPDGFGRWDVLIPNSLCIDLDKWKETDRYKSFAKIEKKKVVVAHSPNHRGCKGTEFIIAAVNELKAEGWYIELKLLEKINNDQVRSILFKDVDILVEQLVLSGHGLSAVEGLATGIPVISNLEDDDYTKIIRRWSYFEECPIVSAEPENFKNILRTLVADHGLRAKLGKAGREYAEKYHGFDSGLYLFDNIIKYVYKEKETIMDLYHPMSSTHSKRLPKVIHPLVKSRITDNEF